MKGILIRLLIAVSDLSNDTFELIQKFFKIYLSKIEHWDKFWYDEQEGSMVQIVGDFLNNIKTLWSLPTTDGMKQAMEVLVQLCLIAFYNYQQALRKPLVKGQIANVHVQEYVTQFSIMGNLVKFLQLCGSKDENLPGVLERFFYKGINLDGTNDGISKILK